MKNIFLLLLLVITARLNAQSLPPTAQALYNWAYNSNVPQGQYAITNSVQVLATADGNSFYLKWFPPSVSSPSNCPLIVTVHGSGSTAFAEFSAWHTKALAKGVGLIAIQFYRGPTAVFPNDYFDDPTLYSYIDTALKRIAYPSNKAMYHGFSRGSARSYAQAFYDRPAMGGKNYFCAIMSNAGGPDSTYNLYANINSGMYGHSLYSGKCWAMFSGGLDTNGGSKPQKMISAKNWVNANGGNVGLFIYDPAKGHGGFHQTPIYIDSVLNFYLNCYSTVGIKKKESESGKVKLYPNPASENFIVSLSEQYAEETISVYDAYGRIIYEKEFAGGCSVDTRTWNKGIYFYRLKSGGSGKVLIE